MLATGAHKALPHRSGRSTTCALIFHIIILSLSLIELYLGPFSKIITMSQRFDVYKVQYKLGMQDPDFNYTRYHTVVFIQTDADSGVYIHHITEDLITGMQYQRKAKRRPEQSLTFHAKEYIGTVAAENYPAAIDTFLKSLQPPPQQKRFNPTTMAYERCKPDSSAYDARESPPPLMKCTEWTQNSAIPTLIQQALIQTNMFEATQPST
jgi:hypothetical protein